MTLSGEHGWERVKTVRKGDENMQKRSEWNGASKVEVGIVLAISRSRTLKDFIKKQKEGKK